MTIYYHVSRELTHNGVFEPRIPSCRHKGNEDSVIPRVSVANSIADCFTAIPNGGGRLDELNMNQRGYYLIFKVDTEKLAISEEDIVDSEILYEKDWVRDAELTNEVWITKPFTVPKEDRFLIQLTDWEETVHDILPYSIFIIADEKYDGDFMEAYSDIYEEHVPCSIAIENIEFIHEDVKAGVEVTLETEDENESGDLYDRFEHDKRIKITEEHAYSLSFITQEAVNLKEVFLYHRELINSY